MLQQSIERHLKGIERILGPGYKLTLVARYCGAKPLDADIVMSLDDLEQAIATIDKMKDRPSLRPP
jgi:hypothetical protein